MAGAMNIDQGVMKNGVTENLCDDPFVKQIAAELKVADAKKRNPLKQLGTLLISLLLFFSMGLFDGSARGIIILIGVIFVHEIGHLIGMKLLKYKDVQMFFIPLFGAAVSGKATAPSGIKKATVSLMGPVPGIIIGVITGFVYIKTKEPVWAELTQMFLFINTFNLLPFHPLDGGRFFEAILFSRHPILEVSFKALTTLALGGIALLLKAPILGFFSIMIFFSLKTTYAVAKIAHEYKKRNRDVEFSNTEEIPDETLTVLVPFVKKMIPSSAPMSPKVVAAHISGIWQRIQSRPSRLSSSVGMVLGYLVFMLVGVCSFFIFVWISYAMAEMTTQVVTDVSSDGSQHRYELKMMGTNWVQKFELNDENFFHGVQIDRHLYSTNVSKIGQWKGGYRHGEFLLYDQEGENNKIIMYENGIPISYQILIDGEFVEMPEDKWDKSSRYIKTQDEPIKASDLNED